VWLFTKYGFFSAVCARQGEGCRLSPVDRSKIAIRSRYKQHLESLKTRFADLIGDAEIRAFPNSDYEYRIFVSKPSWALIASALAAEVDYDNFKSESEKSQHPAGYIDSLHEIWQVLWSNARRRL